jgi:hypothetical protein
MLQLLILFGCHFHPDKIKIGNHEARYYVDGRLRPWTPLEDALRREIEWYHRCPDLKGYPSHVILTFMDGNFKQVRNRRDSIPAMQCATGILSYLEYDRFTRGAYPWLIKRATQFANYIIRDANTGPSAAWPMFPRSTGVAAAVPQPVDCGRQADHPFEVEPDKGGLFAFALCDLYRRTKNPSYLEFALRIAHTLETHMADGDALHSPWPFRVDFRTGQGRGDVSADMGYPLALFDSLIDLGHPEFKTAKAKLWAWILTFQLASLKNRASLWVNFFEDYELPGNRNSWSALSLARILMMRKDRIDPDWRKHSKDLIDFVMNNFVTVRCGIPVCGEQDDDKDPWGGALSTYGAVTATYAKLTSDPAYRNIAFQAIVFCSYAIDTDGCPGQTAKYAVRGGWQEDAHTDVVHNIVEALEAFPEWAHAK